MPDSYGYFDLDAIAFINALPKTDRILDVGPGRGKYGTILKRQNRIIHAVEIFEPYVHEFELMNIYDSVWVKDIRDCLFGESTKYDLVIMGDVLEHLTVPDARKVLSRLEAAGIPVLVLAPFNYMQGEAFGNIHETHLQPDLTAKIFLERYPGFEQIVANDVYGMFFKKWPCRTFPLFPMLEIETAGYCKLRCPACTRNTYPYRPAVQSWFEENNFLPKEVVERIFLESKALGFKGTVCLSHANEPLLDPRLAMFGKLAKIHGFEKVFCCTNCGCLTDEKIAELDGNFHTLSVSIYSGDKDAKMAELNSKFKKTKLEFMIWPMITTHHSPHEDLGALIHSRHKEPCGMPTFRMIVNHRGDMLLCCEDLVGHFDLGSVYEKSIEELWYSEKHTLIVKELLQPCGRMAYSHCRICPR